MSPEQEKNLSIGEDSSEESILELGSKALGDPEVVESEKSTDLSELNIVDVDTIPVLPEQETKSISSGEKVKTAQKTVVNTVAQEKATGTQIIKFIDSKGGVRGSGIYSRVTEEFKTNRKAELKNKN